MVQLDMSRNKFAQSSVTCLSHVHHSPKKTICVVKRLQAQSQWSSPALLQVIERLESSPCWTEHLGSEGCCSIVTGDQQSMMEHKMKTTGREDRTMKNKGCYKCFVNGLNIELTYIGWLDCQQMILRQQWLMIYFRVKYDLCIVLFVRGICFIEKGEGLHLVSWQQNLLRSDGRRTDGYCSQEVKRSQ